MPSNIFKIFLIFLFLFFYPAFAFSADSKEINIQENSGNYHLSVKYPILKNEFADGCLKKLVQEKIDNFKNQLSAENVSSRWKSELFTTYALWTYSARMVSIKLEIYQFTGGAHGMTEIVTATFDLENSQELQLKDIFDPGSRFLEIISEIAQQQLREKLGPQADGEWIKEGTAAQPQNFQHFVLTPREIIFYFEQYSVAPYSAGIQEVAIPLEDLEYYLQDSIKSKTSRFPGLLEE